MLRKILASKIRTRLEQLGYEIRKEEPPMDGSPSERVTEFSPVQSSKKPKHRIQTIQITEKYSAKLPKNIQPNYRIRIKSIIFAADFYKKERHYVQKKDSRQVA